ncbi:putative PEP-binding protein [Tolypothrix sp. VBCCA 56010]|uniref:putative PEP-binding protein n=1 Tax=Tolypothrix sp. VBCCA 56010 TaxID=3137731 RepID=UPI003D7E18BA
MDKLYWLDQIKLQDRAKVGDKAFHLGRIMQRGYPVKPGFIVGASVLRQFLETLNSSEALVADLPYSSLHLDVDNWRQLQQVAGHLHQEIIAATVPSKWVNKILEAAKEWKTACLIFRPSVAIPTATHQVGNISGLLESQICRCDCEAIALALKTTWSQLFRAKSLLYWQRTGIDLRQINLAVLVQPIENALASGLLNSNSRGWDIEATWGLGISLQQGEVQPDVYYIQRETGVVKERQLGNKMLAYRLDDTPADSLALDNTLVADLLKSSQQKQYALKEEYLQQLIELANLLENDLGTNYTVEWTISEEFPTPKLYLTKVSVPQFAVSNTHFLKGIGAGTGRVTATAYVVNSLLSSEQLPLGVILVAQAIAPDWLPFMQKIVGIITEQGGLTSHAAILARELGIPAVVNAKDATALIQTGANLLLDGDRGEVYRVRKEDAESQEVPLITQATPKHKAQSQLGNFTTEPLVSDSPILLSAHLPMIATQLLVNLSQPSLIEQVQSLPVDGVGLLRSELMVLTILEGQHPNSWLSSGRKAELLELWSEQMMQFVRAFAPRPVFYRSLDWRSHELTSFSSNVPSSQQSMLGERGTFAYLQNSAVFELELEAIAAIQQADYNNIHLILPFVRTVEEFSFCRQKVESAGLTQKPQFQLWIMAEVPSVLFLLPEYVKAGVQGISIGTNDLTQLLLGVDREQGELASSFDERHPAVMSAVAQLIKMAKSARIPCSICGQAPALYPEIIDKLVEWGITSISVEPEAVSRTYQAIARAEQRIILEAARRMGNR